MLKGWIKLHRKLKDHFVYKDSEMLHIWLNILLNASHSYNNVVLNGKVVKIFPGQVVFGRLKWSETLKIKNSKIYRTIKLFEEVGMITVLTTNKYSIITVSKWSDYQHFFEENQKSEHHFEQSDEQQNEQLEESENTELRGMGEQENKHSDEQQANTYKNVKNDKNNIYEFWNEKGIVVHRKLTKKMETKINSTLKDYSVEEIKQAIDNYAEIVLNDEYYFSHKWSLDEFLQRGFTKFENREVAVGNYASGNTNKLPEKQVYDPYNHHEIYK